MQQPSERHAIDADLARLSEIVYEPWDAAEERVAAIGWMISDVFDHAGSQAMFCRTRDGNQTALVFRGTEASDFRLVDLWANAGRPILWAGPGRAHSGYDRAFARIRWQARKMVEREAGDGDVAITGHSMGGALAMLYAAWADHRMDALVTFGAPKALNARAIQAIRVARETRYVMPMDFAPSWPPIPGLRQTVDETRLPTPDRWPGPVSRHSVSGYVAALS